EIAFIADIGAECHIATADLAIALPLAADAEVASDVVLKPEAERPVVVVVIEITGEVGRLLHRRAIKPQPPEHREPRQDRPSAERRELPGGYLGIVGKAGEGRTEFAELAVTDLGGKIRRELIAAED